MAPPGGMRGGGKSEAGDLEKHSLPVGQTAAVQPCALPTGLVLSSKITRCLKNV